MTKNKSVFSIVFAIVLLMIGVFCLSFVLRSINNVTTTPGDDTVQNGDNNTGDDNTGDSGSGSEDSGDNNGSSGDNNTGGSGTGEDNTGDSGLGDSSGDNSGDDTSDSKRYVYVSVENAATEYEPVGTEISVSGDSYKVSSDAANYSSYVALNRYGSFINNDYSLIEISFTISAIKDCEFPSLKITPLFYSDDGSLTSVCKSLFFTYGSAYYSSNDVTGYFPFHSDGSDSDSIDPYSHDIKYTFERNDESPTDYLFTLSIDGETTSFGAVPHYVTRDQIYELKQIRIAANFSSYYFYNHSSNYFDITDFSITYEV